MPDDTNKQGQQDRTRINVNESWELDYWCKKFSVSHEELRAAVEKAGPMAKDVEKALGKAAVEH